MEKRTSTTSRRGFTLVESLIASVMLSVSVVGVSGTILASYKNDAYSQVQAEAIRSAAKTMDEMTALPMTAASSSEVGIDDFVAYADQVSTATPSSVVSAVKAKKIKKVKLPGGGSTAPVTGGAGDVAVTIDRSVLVNYADTIAGASVTASDMAVVTVDLTLPDRRDLKLKRLVTTAEAESNVK